MTQTFLLTLSDNVNTLDFMGTVYKVVDGGFNIGSPSVKRELAPVREGFYIPLISSYEYRTAKLTFSVYGATRGAIISSLNSIESLLRGMAARSRLGAGKRGELSYAWAGATNITYFEVYAGDLEFSEDILSVEKMHAMADGGYVLPECVLTLYVSGVGYGASIYADATYAVPLYNPNVGSKTTSGVTINNEYYAKPSSTWVKKWNYVEINKDDVAGGQPFITKICLESQSPYDRWEAMYMGMEQEPFSMDPVSTPDALHFEDTAIYSGTGTTVSDDSASKGSYLSRVFSNTAPFLYEYPTFAWNCSLVREGTYYAFFTTFGTIPTTFQLAAGLYDTTVGLLVRPSVYSRPGFTGTVVPLGVVQSPAGVDFFTSLSQLLGIWVAGTETGGTINLDKVNLMPATNGLRIIRSRAVTTAEITGTVIDNDWMGLQYLLKADTTKTLPVYGLLSSLKLEPNVTQRIYFTSVGTSYDIIRTFKVKVYAVPTYSTLAL